MVKQSVRLILVFFIFCLYRPADSHATHTSAMELYFHWVSDSTYTFTLTFYRNCQGFTASAPFAFTLNAIAPGASASTGLVRLPTSGNNVPPLTPNNLLSCAIANTLCFEEYVYRGNITLPAKSRDWFFYTSLCCTPTETDNVSSASMEAFAGMNNLDFPDSLAKNISLVWHTRRPNIPGHLSDTIINYPIMTFCEMRQYMIDQSAKEYDGDRVKYEFLTFVGGFVSPYSFTYPLPQDTLPAFNIDTALGSIIYKPIPPVGTYGSVKLYLILIKATEYRMDTDLVGGNYVSVEKEISYIMRNVFISTTDSASCPDLSISFSDTTNPANAISSIGITCDNNPIEIALTTPVLCNSIDSNASNIKLVHISTQDTINILKSESKSCSFSNTSSTFSIYLDSALSGGNYRLIFVTGTDGNTLVSECGLELEEYKDTLFINVTPALPHGVLVADSTDGNTDTIEVECRTMNMFVYTSYPVKCNTVKQDGSDFYLVDSNSTSVIVVPIFKAIKTSCAIGYISKINLQFTQPIEAGSYKLYLQDGKDGNTFRNACHRKWPYMSIDVNVPKMEVDLGSDIVICSRDEVDVTLYAPKGFTYVWNTGGFKDSVNVTNFGTYWVQVWTNNGCLSIDTIEIIEKNCTGISESSEDNSIVVYPNPTTDLVNIETDINNSIQVDVFNILGDKVYSENWKNKDRIQFSIPEKNGIYLLQVSDDTGLFKSFKILKTGN